MTEEEDIEVLETYLKNKELFRHRGIKYMFSIGMVELEAMESLIGKYKCYRKQLNDAFGNGFVHKDEVKAKLEKKDKIIEEMAKCMEERIGECPYEFWSEAEEILNCENCEDKYAKCWKEYFEKKEE